MSEARPYIPMAVDPRSLTKELHDHMPGLTLYCGAKTWTKLRVFGQVVWFPPDLNGKLSKHPTLPTFVKCDGRASFRDHYGYLRDRRGRDLGYGPVPGEDVTAFVRFVVKRCQYIVWLTGTDEDKPRMKLARENWHKAQYEAALQVDRARRDYVERWKRDNPGLQPPSPTPKQREARDLLEASESSAGWKEFACPHWDADFDTFEALRAHMISRHNEEPRVLDGAGKAVAGKAAGTEASKPGAKPGAADKYDPATDDDIGRDEEEEA